MRDLFAEIVQQKRMIWWVAILLALYNILRLFSILAAPYPIDQIVNLTQGISYSEYLAVFQNYLQEESGKLHMSPDILKIMIFSFGCMAVGYVFFSVFLGMRYLFAKYAILCLVFIEFIGDLFAGVTHGILPSKISIIVAIFLLLFLFSPHIGKEFK